MVPAPGESCFETWERTGYEIEVGGAKVTEETASAARPVEDGEVLPEDAAIALFYHDVPRDVALDAVSKLRGQSFTAMGEPSPLQAWPDVPTSYILCRDDRVVPPEWSRRVVADRLGIELDEIDGSHSPFLSRPADLADLLESIRLRSIP
jgi:pimeloyl-ACP methyl ester carboxylesterase